MPIPKRFLVVIQYWDGDKKQAEELGDLIADLEPDRNMEVDILIYGRFDAKPFSETTRAKLEAKFNRVSEMRCRRHGSGYPYGANSMFYELVMMLAQPPWVNENFAFINLESDCCPLHPGWTNELAGAYRHAESRGKYATGHILKKPIDHLNGVAVYAIDIFHRTGVAKLRGGSPSIAYDMRHASTILPVALPTPFVVLDFQRPTISAAQLFAATAAPQPAIYHGVKDGSAREAVRMRHLSPQQPVSYQRNVFSYLDPKETVLETERIVAPWRNAWRAQGWAPVILGPKDAARSTAFTRLTDAVEKLPLPGDREVTTQRFSRWLALDSIGGGMFVDLSIFPGKFRPSDIHARNGSTCFTTPKLHAIHAAFFEHIQLKRFIESIIGYDPRVEDAEDGVPSVTDLSVWRAMDNAPIEPTVFEHGEIGYESAKLVNHASLVPVALP